MSWRFWVPGWLGNHPGVRKWIALFVAVLALAAGARWVRLESGLGQGSVTIRGVDFIVDVADDPAEHLRGLRGRAALASGTGMLFVFGEPPSDRTFTMDGVRIALDFVWIRDGRIVGITPNLPPATLTAGTAHPSPQPVTFVLEVAGGTADRYGWNVGDTVALERTDK